ncbi:HNH endonuclease [Bacillus phage Moonbeam]|uniref:HNH homing endonuclease n=1 Tax=Bacillus phage Moonbeam TaxID=1540091 RepID=A0A0A0RV67_9CAUD|nr:HNH endonuclease [Bacillus phage Moonbeam]AIW03523.1 HNH homing endonuclease [Bacillus phage Moonbeam]
MLCRGCSKEIEPDYRYGNTHLKKCRNCAKLDYHARYKRVKEKAFIEIKGTTPAEVKRLSNESDYVLSSKGDIWKLTNNGYRKLKGKVNKTGYHVIYISPSDPAIPFAGKNGGEYYVHRVVATLFIANPNNLPVVNHLDGNPINNDFSNLEWCTQKRNAQHACDTGLSPIGDKLPQSKLTAEKVKVIKDRLHKGEPITSIAEDYGVHRETVGAIKRGISWKHVK